MRIALLLALTTCAAISSELPDIRSVPADLVVPPITAGEPAPGRRVLQVEPEYAGGSIHHVLYLPTDWTPDRRFPVIVEFPGNGPYSNKYGDVSTGQPEGCVLGYGLSAGESFIWLSLPFIDPATKTNQTQWWGDADATAGYAKKAVRRVCDEYGGDPGAVILAGFSRGAIACNYIGLRDDEIARLWLAFFPYSHYDGVRSWDYADSDPASALQRLNRLRGRPSFVTHERSIGQTQTYLESTGIDAPFTLRAVPFRNHNPGWTLRDIPLRRAARRWLAQVLAHRGEGSQP